MTPPAPSMLAGRATSRTTCGCRGRSSSASSTTSSRSCGSTALSSAARMVVLPGAGAAGDEEGQPGRQHRPQQRLAGGVDRAEPRRVARSCAAGRSTRRDRQVPSTATGDSTACSRTPASASHPSTYGLASSSRRPAATASRWASRRTAASSGKRSPLGSRPAPRSTQTEAGPLTRTSVVRGSRSSSSSGPAPTNSWRSSRSAASTSRSEATPPASARTAAATAAGVVPPPAAASRARTRSTSAGSRTGRSVVSIGCTTASSTSRSPTER